MRIRLCVKIRGGWQLRSSSRFSFILAELLVVIAIIDDLIAFLSPTVLVARAVARHRPCVNGASPSRPP